MNEFRFLPVAATEHAPVDCYITSLGFESRSREVARRVDQNAVRRIALPFADRLVLGYPENMEYFERNKYEIPQINDVGLSDLLASILLTPEMRTVRVDISCMTRDRIARIVSACARHPGQSVEFVYGPAQFWDAPEDDAPTTYHGPVLSEFGGWTSHPEIPPLVILGLGFEANRTLGAFDYLDPFEWRAFVPRGSDPRFDKEVHDRNSVVLQATRENWRFEYDLTDPRLLFWQLASLASGTPRDRSVVILPFGPKVFFLASILVGCVSSSTSVWRVSAASGQDPHDRHLGGDLVRICVRFVRRSGLDSPGESGSSV